MEILLWASLLYGAGVVWSFHSVQYSFINVAMSWTKAQQYCRQHHTDLATFWSLDDIYRVNRPSQYGGVAWIGLFDPPNSWKGIMGNDSNSWRWSVTGKPSPGGFHNWRSGEPNNDEGDQLCAIMVNGEWDDRSCSTLCRSVCFTGQKTFSLVSSLMSFAEAQSHCRQHFTDLAMIEDQQENEAVSALCPSEHVWIGLYREAWRWSDGSTSTFTNWNSKPDNANGNQHCTREERSYLWNDRVCGEAFPFICHRVVTTRKHRLLMKFWSGLNLSEPALQNQITQRIGAELQRSGVSDFRLKWKSAPHEE
uniref:C-type lectin domain-containing protein n=1 Tax=Knipowitschia caucasica TaxID=637954 RepID=A0AAV2LVU4_KNICA